MAGSQLEIGVAVDRSDGGMTPLVPAKLRAPDQPALDRDRLHQRLDEVWHTRVGLVVAPAGAGKSTLLARYAASLEVPLAWYRAEPMDGAEASLLRHLEAATTTAFGLPSTGWKTVGDAAAALEFWHGDRGLLVVDDVHALADSPAEAALSALLDYLPPTVSVLLAGRSTPAVNGSRRRVAGGLVELDAGDLRFRSWEAETLFRDVYGEPLRPEDLAALARHTEGWAAGLQLFHLATRGRSGDERRRVLHEVAVSGRLFREYLTANVLARLDRGLQRFLLETSVVPRLSGDLCDALVGRDDSAARLVELERRRVFTVALGDGWYRYHEVLRTALEAMLVEEVGEAAVQQRHRRAAALLEAAGLPAEALVAASRGGDQGRVRRLLGASGATIARERGAWLDRLPQALRRQDPWLLLADARRQRDLGRLDEAVERYRQAEEAFGTLMPARTCRAERQALQPWTGPSFPQPHDDLGLLRAAVTRHPLAAAQADGLVAGLGLLLAGHARAAGDALAAVADDPQSSPLGSAAARIAAGGAALLGGEDATDEVELATDAADRLGAGFLVALGRAVRGLDPGFGNTDGEDWPSAVAALCRGWADLRSGADPRAGLGRARRFFVAMDAEVLAAWCAALDALATARVDETGAAERAGSAHAAARRAGVPGAALVAELAAATCGPRASATTADLRRRLTVLGLEVGPPAAVPRPVLVRCFGGFRLQVGDAVLDLDALKPRARSLLRLLGAAGRAVHREAVLTALWPDTGVDAATRAFHVTVSSLRGLLDAATGGTQAILRRDGEAYRLDLGPEGTHDVLAFEAACVATRAAQASGHGAAAVDACRQALALYGGDLLPEEGPAEWVVGEREHHRQSAATVACVLADLLEARDDLGGAAEACERAVAIDRFRDDAWLHLEAIHERAGRPAAAAAARRRYEHVLAGL